MAGNSILAKLGSRTLATGVGTNAGVTVTQATPGVGYVLTCLDIDVSSDAAAVVTIESPSGTVLWRLRYAAAFTLQKAFEPGLIKGASNAAMLVKVSASTSNSEANLVTAPVGG